jgi:hypothetical protein
MTTPDLHRLSFLFVLITLLGASKRTLIDVVEKSAPPRMWRQQRCWRYALEQILQFFEIA